MNRDVTATLHEALQELHIEHSQSLGAITGGDGHLYAKSTLVADNRLGVTVRFDAWLAADENQVLTPVSTLLHEGVDAAPTPLHAACRDWAQTCWPQLIRATRCDPDDDSYFNLFLAEDKQSLFSAFSGDYLVHGENSEAWSKRFAHSLFDWVIAKGELRFPAQRFVLLRLGMRCDSNGKSHGLSLLNGDQWEAADSVVAQLDWPGVGEQQIINYVVLRRIPAAAGDLPQHSPGRG